ncbi:methyl-accepting chemotaxis protein [Natranaerovirga hydrolytica]|uniref:Methyl-accepting chemotaxis protein n=1 Tax=Natranaerovirga hydrolytica TaxID=680378 RepID=A0A4R1MKB7_9FIRM|nr:methyl-accepting chemotaxis protein [Natranaerovirga hydrolytica]TCK93258.1 methyl-accepting chemotaxis protein [Natranaerovirga hydrolytica]
MKQLKWKNLRIGLKYAVVVAIIMVMFVISSILTNGLLMGIEKDMHIVNSRNDHALAIVQLDNILKDKNINIAGYIEEQSEEYLIDYESLTQRFNTIFERLLEESENERVVEVLDSINRTHREIDNVFENQIITALNEDNVSRAQSMRAYLVNLQYQVGIHIQEIQDLINEDRQMAIEDANNAIIGTRGSLITSIIGAIMIGGLLLVLISRRIRRSFKDLIHMNDEISKGNLTVEPIKYSGKDEIGILSQATIKMLSSLNHIIKELMASADNVTQNSDRLMNLSREVREINEQISGTMEEMSSGAEEQANFATNVLESVEKLNQLIESSNSKGDRLEESSHKVLEITSDGENNMQESIEQMSRINEIVSGLVNKINDLEVKSQNISQLVEVINAIAEETNLLALNAAIEAARAGESGRGFAVVADEIRKLAEQSASSVLKITEIVEGVQSETKEMTSDLQEGFITVENGSNQLQITGESFANISQEVHSMVNEIKEVSESLSKIKENSSEIQESIEQIASISQENSAGIEETTASVEQQEISMTTVVANAEDLKGLAEDLNKIVNQFKV